jgi:hypothetical protein
MAKHLFRSDGADEAADEWLVAESLDGRRTYLVHARRPRFLTEVLDEEDVTGILDGLSYSLPSGQSLARFAWLDSVDWQAHPVEPDLLKLLERAGEALAEYDERLNADVTRDEDEEDF